MLRIGYLLGLTLLALGLMSARSEARGGRGGGFGGGGRSMGSVRHSSYYRPQSYARYRGYDDARQAVDHTQAAYHHPVAADRVRVPPPAWGARVATLPAGYRRRWWRNRFWYYGNDMWYVENSGEYVASQPPIGMIVHALPEGAVQHTVNGQTYYEYNGVWFKPIMSGGGASYEVVSPPKGA